MKTKLRLLLCYLIISLNLNAQQDSFKLSDYRLPNFDFRSLDAEFFLGTSNTYNGSSTQFLSTESISNSFSTNSTFNYFRLKNDSTWQRSTNASFAFDLSYSDRSSSSPTYDNSLKTAYLLIANRTNRKYTEPNIFREINLFFLSQFIWEKARLSNNINSTETKPHFLRNMIVVPFKVGRGRIDQVTDARQAIFILERLKKQGRLNRTANKEEIRAFAEHISRINNRRYFDFRLRRIYELEKVDSFLQANNFISKTDMKYFAHLNDMWVYGNDQIRYSGSRLSLNLNPGLSHFVSRANSGAIPYDETIFSLVGGLGYLSEVPLNVDWQNTLNVNSQMGFAMGKRKNIETNHEETFLVPLIELGINESLIYYPDTRTTIRYSFGIRTYLLANNIGKGINLNGLNAFYLAPSTSVSFNYFLSPRLQLDISGSIAYSWKKEFESEENPSIITSTNQQLNSIINSIPNSFRFSNYNIDRRYSYLQYRFNVSLSYGIF